MGRVLRLAALVACLSVASGTTQLWAQEGEDAVQPAPTAGAKPAVDEIIVFARKRDETLQDAPVAITAFRSEDLERYDVSSIEDAASLTPGLVINSGGGATGATITLRGVGTGNFSAAVDQAVSTNIDGVQISRGLIVRQGLFDMAQIEILKGPQALFFGKNSPGGIIAIRTADPTDELFAQIGIGYGVRARDKNLKAILSGPVSDKIGARAAFQVRFTEGPFENLAHAKRQTSLAGGLVTNQFEGSNYERTPDATEYTGRFTLTYDATSDLSFRLKFSATDTRNSGRNSTAQLYSCPSGSFYRLFNQGVIDCELDERVWVPNTEREVAAIQPMDNPQDGRQYEKTRAYLASLEARYALEDFSIHSVTGFYDRDSINYQDVSYNDFTSNFGSLSVDAYRAISQELRFQSEFEGRFNFMVGVYFQDEFTDIDNNGTIGLSALLGLPGFNLPLPDALTDLIGLLPSLPLLGPIMLPAQLGGAAIPLQGAEVDSVTYSGFAQADFDVWRDMVNLSVGLRYTYEEKGYLKTAEDRPATTPIPVFGLTGLGPVEGGLSGERDFTNLSPEATVTVQPNEDWTIYGSYKQGYKSGGYNTSLFGDPDSLNDVAFDEETVAGYEGGVKARLLNGALNLNFNAYWYTYSDLQTSFLEGITLRVINAEDATVRGVEFDVSYAPALVEGLVLRGAFNRNRGRYEDFVTACYQGQTEAQGCDLPLPLPINPPVPVPGTNPAVQNLAGQQMFQAPDWSANAGVSYIMPVLKGRYLVGLNADAIYTGSFQSHDKANPIARQASAWRFNAALSLASADDRFLLSVIGTNLTNELRATFTMESPLPGLVPGTPADLIAFTSAPRAILLRATVTY